MRADLLPGIGGHRVERELGSGGMGRVYLCHDDALDRRVAVKVLQPELLGNEEMRARFLREARALARVSSPHVVMVHTVGEDPVAGPFVVMEYLDGEDLQQRIGRERRVPWRDAVRITRDSVQGLMAAEAVGIVHRDIKPANLFDVAGKAKLTDFGLARQVQGSAGVTQAGLVVGTPAYLAPEVVRGAPASHQSDLYSLGATLFHMVSGRPPFNAESPLEVVSQALREEPPSLLSLVPDVPSALDALVGQMLKKTPEERPQGWAALDDALRALLTDATAGRTLMGMPSQPLAAVPHSNPAGPAGPAGAPEAPDAIGQPANPTLGTLPTMAMQLAAGDGARAETAPQVAAPEVAAPILVSGEHGAPRIKTAALTVMMTDIAGYTERTSRVSREESARWLSLHDALLQPVFKSFGGRVVKTLGDAFLVTFSSPTDAVHCACAVQDRLWLYNRGQSHGPIKPEDEIRVRVALSTGEVRLHKGDIFGEPVNLAARIEGLAQPGEVLLSDAVYATMNAAEVKLTPRGEQQLKGISRPVMIYAAVPDGVADQPPFGGRALARTRSTGAMGDLVAQAGPPMRSALDKARTVLGPRGLAVAAAAAALVAVIALLARGGDNRLERIDAGEARAVVEEIEKAPTGDRTGNDLLVLGHAQLKLGNTGAAWGAYLAATKKSAVDDRLRAAALAGLGDKDAAGPLAVLTAWPGGSIEGDLRPLLGGDDWWPRHHALTILDDRKAVDDDDRERVALLDIAADNCLDRKVGVLALRKIGKSDDALAAVQKLGADPVGNFCMLLEMPDAERQIKKRQQ